jgi:hypothetical protein
MIVNSRHNSPWKPAASHTMGAVCQKPAPTAPEEVQVAPAPPAPLPVPAANTRRSSPVTHIKANELQERVQDLVEGPVDSYFPPCVLSYATGGREGYDMGGGGPGLVDAAEFVLRFAGAGIATFSGLHVPAGTNWKVYFTKLDSRGSKCKVFIVLLTKAFYQSKNCLKEVETALKCNKVTKIIPVRMEEVLPGKEDQWKSIDINDSGQLLRLTEVQDGLGKLNCFPARGTLQSDPSYMGKLMQMVNDHLSIPTSPEDVTIQWENRPERDAAVMSNDNETDHLSNNDEDRPTSSICEQESVTVMLFPEPGGSSGAGAQAQFQQALKHADALQKTMEKRLGADVGDVDREEEEHSIEQVAKWQISLETGEEFITTSDKQQKHDVLKKISQALNKRLQNKLEPVDGKNPMFSDNGDIEGGQWRTSDGTMLQVKFGSIITTMEGHPNLFFDAVGVAQQQAAAKQQVDGHENEVWRGGNFEHGEDGEVTLFGLPWPPSHPPVCLGWGVRATGLARQFVEQARDAVGEPPAGFRVSTRVINAVPPEVAAVREALAAVEMAKAALIEATGKGEEESLLPAKEAAAALAKLRAMSQRVPDHSAEFTAARHADERLKVLLISTVAEMHSLAAGIVDQLPDLLVDVRPALRAGKDMVSADNALFELTVAAEPSSMDEFMRLIRSGADPNFENPSEYGATAAMRAEAMATESDCSMQIDVALKAAGGVAKH